MSRGCDFFCGGGTYASPCRGDASRILAIGLEDDVVGLLRVIGVEGLAVVVGAVAADAVEDEAVGFAAVFEGAAAGEGIGGCNGKKLWHERRQVVRVVTMHEAVALKGDEGEV